MVHERNECATLSAYAVSFPRATRAKVSSSCVRCTDRASPAPEANASMRGSCDDVACASSCSVIFGPQATANPGFQTRQRRMPLRERMAPRLIRLTSCAASALGDLVLERGAVPTAVEGAALASPCSIGRFLVAGMRLSPQASSRSASCRRLEIVRRHRATEWLRPSPATSFR